MRHGCCSGPHGCMAVNITWGHKNCLLSLLTRPLSSINFFSLPLDIIIKFAVILAQYIVLYIYIYINCNCLTTRGHIFHLQVMGIWWICFQNWSGSQFVSISAFETIWTTPAVHRLNDKSIQFKLDISESRLIIYVCYIMQHLQCQLLLNKVTNSLYVELTSCVIELVYGMCHIKGQFCLPFNSTFCSLNHLNSLSF